MKTHYCILLFLFLLSTISKAQISIAGRILNKAKGPIEFANVVLMNTTANELLAGTISGEDGSFQIKTDQEAPVLLSIQFIGFEDWTQVLTNNEFVNLGEIILLENANNLAEAIVTASRPVIERREDQLVFNIASSSLNAGYDGVEVLSQTPYVWVDSDDNIQMRNQSATILINGRPLNLSGADLSNYIKNIRSDNIKSIEVQTTPAANSDASNTGGVINIVLRKKVVGFNSTLRTSYELFGEGYYHWNSGLNFNYGAERWNMYGSYNQIRRENTAHSNTDIFYYDSGNYLQTEVDFLDDRQRHNYQFGFVIDAWKNHEFGAEFFGSTRDRFLTNISYLSLTNEPDTIDSGITSASNEITRNLNSGVINYTWNFDTLNSTLKIIADKTIQKNNDINNATSVYDLGWFNDNQIRNSFDNETDIFALQADLVKNLNRGWKGELGAKRTTTNRDNNLLAEELLSEIWTETAQSRSLNYKENINAAYANASKSFLKKHFIKIGLRVENTDLERIDLLKPDTISKNYTDWFPSIYYAYDFSEEASVSANYSRRLSRPAFYELNNDVRKVNDFRYSIGNPDLRPEYIDIYEIKAQWKKQTASIYYRQANEAINGIYFLLDSIAYYQRQNNGAQKQIGLQYNISQDVNKRWSFRLSAHFYNRKYTNDDGEDSFQKSTISLRLFNTFKINKTTSVDVNARYLSPSEDAFYQQNEFYNVNIILKKSFLNKKLNCRIYLNDIFNTTRYGNTRPFDDIITTLKQKPRSRSITFWLTYNFSNQGKTNNKKTSSARGTRDRL